MDDMVVPRAGRYQEIRGWSPANSLVSCRCVPENSGERPLGCCGLAPGTPLRERPSSDARCASMMDSDVGLHRRNGNPGRVSKPSRALASAGKARLRLRVADGRCASIRPVGACLSARAPSLPAALAEPGQVGGHIAAPIPKAKGPILCTVPSSRRPTRVTSPSCETTIARARPS